MASKYPQILYIISVIFLVGIASAEANHSWKGHHWERKANPVNLAFADNLSVSWQSVLKDVSNDWNTSGVVHLTVSIGGKDPKKCRTTHGRIDVCSASYGNTDWLGIAQIRTNGRGHITQGTVQMNDTYFKKTPYNTRAWKRFVLCQEIGHTLGLDHQDEIKKNANLGTCMDYTKDPSGLRFGQPNNEHPNAHDYKELETVYAHFDKTTLFGIAISLSAGNTLNMDNSQEWGRVVRVSYDGKSSVHECGFGKDGKVFTFVVWTD